MINARPYYLIDDTRMDKSGWDIDNRGAGCVYGNGWVTKRVKSIGNGFATTFTRPVTVQTNGTVNLELNFKVESGNGFYIGLFDDEKPIVMLKQDGNSVTDAGGNVLFKMGKDFCFIKLSVDLDNRKAELWCNGKRTENPCLMQGTKLQSLKFGYSGADVGETVVSTSTKLYKNYIFNDCCVNLNVNSAMSDEYEFASSGNAKAFVKEYYSSIKTNVYCIKTFEKTNAELRKSFSTDKGFEFRVKYFIKDEESKLSLSLCGGNIEFQVVDFDKIICCDNKEISHHRAFVWQSMRIAVDKQNRKIDVYHNTRKVYSADIASETDFDTVKISFETQNASELLFTDFQIFDYVSEYEQNYVPKPVKPKKTTDCQIGINICSLWRGGHNGWDCITPFPENKPLLGYYDEGIPETADWEIKWMAEHGIDFELYCWYATEPDIPFVDTLHYWQLDEAHRYARYSSEVKFALMWEVGSAKCPSNFASFKEYYVPYWIDHYFSDPRYYTIDGYAFMSIYGSENFIASIGGTANAKVAIDYLRAEVKKLGYRGLIVTACAAGNLKLCVESGIDAFQAYHWGRDGFNLEYTEKMIRESEENQYGLHFIPTVSTGFSGVAWHGVKFPNMSVSDFKKALEFCRDEVLPNVKVTEQDTWKKKLVMLSTWNEYGEGTYIMPSGLNGFGYLDAIKEVFAKGDHKDVIPTQEQLSRINILHPKDRKLIAPLGNVRPKPPVDTGKTLKEYTFSCDADLQKWEFHDMDAVEIKNGKLCGHSHKSNPYMVLKDTSFLPVEANRIAKISIAMRSSQNFAEPDCVQVFLSKDKNGKFPRFRTFGAVTDPNIIKEYTFPFEDVSSRLKSVTFGILYSFRIDPVFAAGHFEIEKIVFEEAAPVTKLYIDGEAIDLILPIVEKDDDILIPFDTVGNVAKRKELYWKWDEKSMSLYLYGIKDAVFTVGSDCALIDGKKIGLRHKTELIDGVPLIPVELYAEILGKKFENIDNTIRIFA